MNTDFINLKDRAALEQARTYLEPLPVYAGLLDKEIQPHPTLLVTLPEHDCAINVMYVPLPEDQFNEIRLLQFYSLLTDAVKEPVAELVRAANEANVICPLGSFSVNEEGELAFKYISPVMRFEFPAEGPFTELFVLFQDCLLNFKDVLLSVASGESSADEAIAGMRE